MSVDPIVVSWSEIDTGRQCKLKHHLSYNERWTKPVDDNSPLGKGVLWHTVVETRYNVIMAHQMPNGGWDVSADELEALATKEVNALLDKFTRDGGDAGVAALMGWMYRGYVDVYGLDPEHTIMGVETTHLAPLGTIDLPDPSSSNGLGTAPVPVVLKFKIDRTVKDNRGHVRVIDEKSHGQLPTDHDYDFLDQFGLYVWGLKKLGINVRGAIHSASKTKQNQGDIFKEGDEGWKSSMKSTPLDARFKRTNIHYTEAQLAGIAADALQDVQDLYSPANKHQRQTDSDRCRWRCSYTEACLFGRRTGKPGDTVRMLALSGFTQERERH